MISFTLKKSLGGSYFLKAYIAFCVLRLVQAK